MTFRFLDVISFVDEQAKVACDGRSGWPECEKFLGHCDQLKDCFINDFERADASLNYVFDGSVSVEQNRFKTILLVREIERGAPCFSTLSLLAVAVEKFAFIDEHRDLVKAVLMAGFLADFENNLPYHSHIHFKKVVLHMIRLIAAFQRGDGFEVEYLSFEQIALLLCAAAVHDLGHDGHGNFIDGVYFPARLEKKSFAYSVPFLGTAGVSVSFLDDLEILLVATDASPGTNAQNPAAQVRAFYLAHYEGGTVAGQDVVCEELACLSKRADLSLLCMMLHEADLYNSAALSFDFMLSEAILLHEEINKGLVYPSNCLEFLENLCHGRFFLRVAAYLGQDVFDSILTRVRQDVESGDTPYT